MDRDLIKSRVVPEVVQIMYDNPDIFPIAEICIEYEKSKGIDQGWAKLHLESVCNLGSTFDAHFDAIKLLLTPCDITFMGMYEDLLIKAILNKYSNKGDEFVELMKRLKLQK
jgi:hypothetical protein